MKRAFTAAALAILCSGAAAWPSVAQGGSLQTASAFTRDETSIPNPHWFDPVAGRKLVSVDGSSITLAQSEGGLELEIVSPGGAERDLLLSFVSDGIGTISDGGNRAIGVFRQTDTGLNADFADGHSEAFTINSAGGISMVLNGPAASAYCMRWYPDGYTFGTADRKAALAAYANQLGLADEAAQKTAASASCSEVVPGDAAPSAKPHHSRSPRHETQTASTALDGNVSAQPISVRTSEVHLIDAPEQASAQAIVPTISQPLVQPIVPKPKWVEAPAQTSVPLQNAHPVQQLASAAPDKSAPRSHAASSCLSIDSDGDNWGFRNGCDYAVQFAYCLKNGNDKATACGTGSGTGNVAANGFASVLSNSAIVTAEQEFRWVACVGGADQVAAHLDRPDPPAGRCVPMRAS